MAIVVSMSIANAQDLVTKTNGEDIKAKVLEITTDEVKYRLYDGPTVCYTAKSDIVMIRYESGEMKYSTRNQCLILFRQRVLADIKPDRNTGT